MLWAGDWRRPYDYGDPKAETTTMGPVSNRTQFEKIQRLLEKGVAEGATVVIGGIISSTVLGLAVLPVMLRLLLPAPAADSEAEAS